MLLEAGGEQPSWTLAEYREKNVPCCFFFAVSSHHRVFFLLCFLTPLRHIHTHKGDSGFPCHQCCSTITIVSFSTISLPLERRTETIEWEAKTEKEKILHSISLFLFLLCCCCFCFLWSWWRLLQRCQRRW